MEKLALALLVLFLVGCSYTRPFVASIAPAGEQGLLVEKCKVQMNPFTSNISTSDCNTSYVWIGGEKERKAVSDPNNNVITIK